MVAARSELFGEPRTDRAGWTGVAAITALVMLTWAPRLMNPLPGNHIGNVAARYGLHVRNLYDDGIVGSHFSADWLPYRTTPYAHHPPLLNVLDGIVGLLPGETTFQVLLVPFLLAATAIPAAAWLLREIGFGWTATLLANGSMVATGYFWVYSQVMVDLGPILALAAGVVRLRAGSPGRRLETAVAALAFVTALTSWPGIAFAAALVAWLWIRRRNRGAVRVVIAAAIGVTLSLVFMIGAGGAGALVDQTGERTTGGSYPMITILRRVRLDLVDLMPWWYLVVFPVAIVVGLLDRRTRSLVAVSSTFAVGWILALGNGAYAHDYWAYLLLVPGLLGIAALVDLADRAMRRPTWVGPGRRHLGTVLVSVAGFGVLATFVHMAYGPMAAEYVHRPTDGGRLIEQVDLPPDQRFAWVVGFDFGRVLAYRLDRPVAGLTDVELPDLADDELILVDLDRLPSWYPVVTAPTPISEHNGYAFVRADSLREALSDDPNSF